MPDTFNSGLAEQDLNISFVCRLAITTPAANPWSHFAAAICC